MIRLSKNLKKSIPDIHIRTTLIVGFPGETEEDYEELIDFVEHERFARLGVFLLIHRKKILRQEMENQIDEEIKEQRLDGIMRRQLDISLELNREKNRQHIGGSCRGRRRCWQLYRKNQI